MCIYINRYMYMYVYMLYTSESSIKSRSKLRKGSTVHVTPNFTLVMIIRCDGISLKRCYIHPRFSPTGIYIQYI